ncbi:MAG: 30S ribosome-binding factor RbfA [Bdellovibrionota bacterium]
MADSRRILKVEKELQQLIASYIARGVGQKLYGLVSVSRVQVTEKLRTAKVFISVLGSDEDRDNSMEILNERLKDIQKHVASKLSMRFTPRLSFTIDHGFEHMIKIESLLHDISKKRKSDQEEE